MTNAECLLCLGLRNQKRIKISQPRITKESEHLLYNPVNGVRKETHLCAYPFNYLSVWVPLQLSFQKSDSWRELVSPKEVSGPLPEVFNQRSKGHLSRIVHLGFIHTRNRYLKKNSRHFPTLSSYVLECRPANLKGN